MMKDQKYNVITPPYVSKKLRRMETSEKEKFIEALKALEDKSLSILLGSRSVQKIASDVYLKRVGFKNRILFAEKDNRRYILEIGTTEEIIKRLQIKAEQSN